MRLSCEAGMRGEGAESAYWGAGGQEGGTGGQEGEGAWSGEIRETRAVEGEE